MFTFPSWIQRTLGSASSALLGRLTAAFFGLLLASDVSAQSIQFTSSAYSVNENGGVIRVAVRRLGDVNKTSSVVAKAESAGGASGAIDGVDFVARTATLTFPTNSTEAFFDIVILDNDTNNISKFINLTLSNFTGGSPGFPTTATVEILDDESGVAGVATGVLSWSATAYTVTDLESTFPRAISVTDDSYPGAMVTVVRSGGNRGRILVDISTGTGTAYTNIMYFPFRNITVALDDYQMSTNILIPIFQYTEFPFDLRDNLCWATNDTRGVTNSCVDVNGNPIPPRPGARLWPFQVFFIDSSRTGDPYLIAATNAGPFSLGQTISPTWYFPVILSNPRLDPAETHDLPAPTLGTDTANVGIVFVDAIGTPDAVQYQNLGMSFERAHYRATEEPGGLSSVRWNLNSFQMWVNRDGTLDTPLVRYRVNNRNNNSAAGDSLLNTFPLQAGSDYATPFIDYLPPGSDPFWAIVNPANNGQDATIQWGQTELGPKPLVVPLVRDDTVEFDEDLQVQLYLRTGDSSRLAAPAAPPFGPAPTRASLTIVFDRIRVVNSDIFHLAFDTNGVFGAEQPAGAVDRRYNRHSENDIDPPFNPTPGANASVLATAIGQDGKLYIGGEFESVNTRKTPYAFHLARMTRDGQVDTNFVTGNGPNGAVTAIELQPDGKAIIGGLFSSFDGSPRNGIARVNVNGSIDATFTPGLGANAPVRALKVLSDNKILIAGEFTSYDKTNVNYLARLNPNGTLDTSFNSGGSGPDDFVYSIALSGAPAQYHALRSLDVGQRRERVDVYDSGSNAGTVILDYDFGTSDPDFIRIYYAGQLILDTGLALGTGSATVSFGPGPIDTTLISVIVNEAEPGVPGDTGSWAYQLTILPALDSQPVIGGRFNNYNGVSRGAVARINLDGSLDTSFNPGNAIENGIVFAVVKHGNKPIIGGGFSGVNRLGRSNIAQINPDGSVDQFFDPGTGFDDVVNALVVQPSGKVIAGGLFTSFNGSRRVGLARLNHDGKLDTTFMDTAYNQFAGIPTHYAVSPPNSINAMATLGVTNIYSETVQYTLADNTTTNITFTFTRSEDQLFIGGSFKEVGGGYFRDDRLPRNNFARIWAGSTPGPGAAGFLFDNFTADEDSGYVFISVTRDLGILGALSAEMSTTDLPQGPGAATDTLDYFGTSQSVLWPAVGGNRARRISDSFRGPNSLEYYVPEENPGNGLAGTNSVTTTGSSLFVSILDDTLQEGDEQVQLNFTALQDDLTLGGVPIPTWPALARSTARLTIIDNDFDPGVISFAQSQYFVDEVARKAHITLIRTNGSNGRVTVEARTRTPGTTATPSPAVGADFVPISSVTVVFAAGQTNATFDVDIIDDSQAELDENISLALSNPSNGAVIGLGTATLTIIDNDFAPGRISFTTSTNSVSEGDGFANVAVHRTGGSLGSEQVQVSTFDVTARAGTDYLATNVILRWTNGETADKIVSVPVIDTSIIDGTRRFKLVLSNSLVNGASDTNALGNQKEIAVDILDNDAYGNVRLSQSAYVVDENGTNATITLIRVGGLTGEVGVGYTATPDLAVPGQDFTPVSGTFIFTNGQMSASFVVPIIDDNVVDGTKTVVLNITGQTNDPSGAQIVVPLTSPSTATLSIIDNELQNIPAGSLDVTFLAEGADDFIYTIAQQSDGYTLLGGDFRSVNSVLRNRLARLNPDGTIDPSFYPGTGPDKAVRALQVQQDGRIVIGGAFTNYNGVNRSFLARLVRDGSLDTTFNPGSGANNPVYSLIIQADGKIVLGGDFSEYNAIARSGIARLNQNGTLDASFTPGTGAGGLGAFTVYSLAQQLDGKILVGGDFTSFNGTPANHLVRLNLNGSVDTTFNTSIGMNGSVRAITIQPDGRILIGGLFTQVQGAAANRVARLNPDGTIDSSFNSGAIFDASKRGANGAVDAIAVQIDGKIVLGGDFTQYNGLTRRGLTRLNSDGQNDSTINFGTGANGSVASLVVQPDRRIIIAGGFTEYDGQPRLRIARINGGSIKGAGRLEFASSSYTVSEAGTNVLVTVRRVGGTASTVKVHYQTADDPSVAPESRAVAGVDYQASSGDLTFPEGETQATLRIQVFDDTTVEPDKIFDVVLSNPTGEPGAEQPTLGDQPSATIVETSDDSEVSFSVASYSVGESAGAATVTLKRTGSVSVPVSLTFFTKDGTATSGADYVGLTNTVTFNVGDSERSLTISILPDLLVEGNEFVNLYVTNLTSGGVFKAGGASATLTIVDDDFAPGQIQFQRPTYSVREGNVTAEISVIRTNGLTGVVTVDYATSAVNATPDQDYKNVSGILTFNDGVAEQFIRVQIFDDDLVENNEVINLALSNVHGGATLGLANATLTIVDDDLGSGSLDTAFDPGVGANGTIRAIELDTNRRFVIAGDFTAFNNDSTRSRIARLLQTGALDAAFKTNNRPNNSIASLALYPAGDQRILIGGNFNTIQGAIENKVARLDADGGLDASFQLPLGLNAQVSSIAIQPDGKIVIGGIFDQASAAARNHVARLNSSGTVDISFDPGTGADRPVNVVALQPDGRVLIGGEFNTINGISSPRLARLNSNGSVDTTFAIGNGFSRPDGRAVVYDVLVLPDSRILVAGDFTSYKGVARTNIAILTATGALDASFGAQPANILGAIRTVATQSTERGNTGTNSNKILIGGDFTSIDGTIRGRVARLDAAGRFDPSFDPGDGANDSVLGIIVQPWDGRVVVAGAFTEFNNNAALHGIARLNNDKVFLPTATSEIRLSNLSIQSGALSLTFTGDSGVNYVIEGATDFNTWTSVKPIVGTGSSTTTTVPIDSAYRFFRVRAL